MFEINLMKYRIASERRRRWARLLLGAYAVLWLLSAGWMVAGYWSNRKAVAAYAQRVASMEQELHIHANGLSPDILRTMGSRLAPVLAAAARIQNGRVRWGPKLQEISRQIPDGMWIRRIYTRRVSSQEERTFPALVLEGERLFTAPPADTLWARLSASPVFLEGVDSVWVASVEGPRFQILCALSKENPYVGLTSE